MTIPSISSNTRTDGLVTNSKTATSRSFTTGLWQKKLYSLAFAIGITDCDMLCFCWGVFEWEMRTFMEWIRIIIRIIFSAINTLNSALHLTQTYCILPKRTAAQHIVIWTAFGTAFDIFAINKLLRLNLYFCHVFLYTAHIFKKSLWLGLEELGLATIKKIIFNDI